VPIHDPALIAVTRIEPAEVARHAHGPDHESANGAIRRPLVDKRGHQPATRQTNDDTPVWVHIRFLSPHRPIISRQHEDINSAIWLRRHPHAFRHERALKRRRLMTTDEATTRAMVALDWIERTGAARFSARAAARGRPAAP